PATVPLRPTRSSRGESKPSVFPVLVCDGRLPPGTTHASVAGHALPVPKATPRRIVVIGDTGCRMKRSDDTFQACNDPNAWPFAAGRDCNDAADDAIGDFSDPYAVPIAAATQFLVFDSSKVGVDPLSATEPMYTTYTAQLREAFALANRRPGVHNLFMNHHPILAF